ncbi:MAG: hypothetical protein AMJ69_10065 [Gammaproteobacteria bacterium SG8_47]|nr:MAG: hypothetical protein AMJ69_10065 [Gammaproteobacteria bacterium SG8_47]
MRILIACLLGGVAMLGQPASASDVARGKELHDANCIRCHASMFGGDGSGIYTRTDRRVESMTGLRQQIERCKNSLGVSWPAEDIDSVIAYLNTNFYKFEQ